MNKNADFLKLYKVSKQTALAHPILRKCCPDEWLEIGFGFANHTIVDAFAHRQSQYLHYGIVLNNDLKHEGFNRNDIIVLDKYQKPKHNDIIAVKTALGVCVQKIQKQGSYRYAKALCPNDQDLGCLWRENYIGTIVKTLGHINIKK